MAAGPGVLLVKPSTFMNESGLCVGPMMRFFKLIPAACSSFMMKWISLGVIKLREKGSAGGHNGIKSPSPTWAPRNSRASVSASASPVARGNDRARAGQSCPEERELLDVTLGKAEDAVLYTMEHGITRAGNIFNAVPG